jgi:hypothetical protein
MRRKLETIVGTPVQLDRRAFLSLLSASAGLAWVGCGDSGGAGPSPSATPDADASTDVRADVVADTAVEGGDSGGPKTMFEVWRDMQQAVRSSPDHLVAEADRRVASKDPESIFRFVRDSIRTLPADEGGFGAASTRHAWGTRATLRAGAGTLRDKADLLAELYQRAGLKAAVVSAGLASSFDPSSAGILDPKTLTFTPTVDDPTWARWRAVLGLIGAAAPLPFVDEAGKVRAAIAAKIKPLLPASLSPASFDFSSLMRFPLVSVEVSGKTVFANPAFSGATFGETYTYETPGPADPASEPDIVMLKVSVTTTDAPDKLVDVVSGEFSVSDLVGRRALLAFVPTCVADGQWGASVESVTSFMPLIALHGMDLTDQQMADLCVAGTVLDMRGNVVSADSTGKVTVNGRALVSSSFDPTAAARVASLAVEANPVSFPLIKLRARAVDSLGKAVAGLGASSWKVEEDGVARPFTLMSNDSPFPRVLFILDTSTSLPPAFLGAEAAKVVRQIAERFLLIDPTCTFQVGAVDGGLTTPSTATPDPLKLEADALAVSGYASELWKALDDAAQYSPTLIVFLTDGASDSPPTADQLSRIASSVPAVMIGVGTVDMPSLEKMAAASGGKAFLVSQPDEAVNASATFLKERTEQPVEINYEAPSQGPSTRSVKLTLVGTTKEAQTTYNVPAVADGILPPALCGIHLTVTWGSRTFLRTIVGLPPEKATAIPQALLDEVRYALFGATVISFEGEAPTLSQWIDDYLAAKLSLEPLWNAVQAGDAPAARAAFSAGLRTLPSGLPNLHLALQEAPFSGPVPFSVGLRAVLTHTRVVPGKGTVRRVDILPLTRFASVSTTPQAAFERTLESSLLLSLAESKLFQNSTVSLLENQDLRLLDTYPSVDTDLADLDAATRQTWGKLLEPYAESINVLPKSGKPFAFYCLDPRTGTAIGVLPDGTGGGSSSDPKAVGNAALGLLNWASLLGELGGFGFAFGAFVALQKAILKVIIAEAIAVSQIGGDGDPFSGKGPICDLACDLAKSAAWELTGMGKVSKADAWAEAVTGKSIPCGC